MGYPFRRCCDTPASSDHAHLKGCDFYRVYEPTQEELTEVVAQIDAEGPVAIEWGAMQRSWPRSHVLQKMLGDEHWERYLALETAKLRNGG